jgi:hypothetical protein
MTAVLYAAQVGSAAYLQQHKALSKLNLQVGGMPRDAAEPANGARTQQQRVQAFCCMVLSLLVMIPVSSSRAAKGWARVFGAPACNSVLCDRSELKAGTQALMKTMRALQLTPCHSLVPAGPCQCAVQLG